MPTWKTLTPAQKHYATQHQADPDIGQPVTDADRAVRQAAFYERLAGWLENRYMLERTRERSEVAAQKIQAAARLLRAAARMLRDVAEEQTP